MSFYPPNQRVQLKVQYIASSSHHAGGVTIHFFRVAEQGPRTSTNPRKRLLVLADRIAFLDPLDASINRHVKISNIDTMAIFEDHLRPLTGPFNRYDEYLQTFSMKDFMRLIGAIFKPNDPANPCAIYELEENQPLARRVNCRLSTAAVEDGVSRQQSEEIIKRIREANLREVNALKEAMQRQKEEQLHELVDLHTQNEQLKHTLSQTENLLMEAKRSGKEERVALLGRNQVLHEELERKGMSSPAPHTRAAASIPTSPPSHFHADSAATGRSPPLPTSPAPHSSVPTINIYTSPTSPPIVAGDGEEFGSAGFGGEGRHSQGPEGWQTPMVSRSPGAVFAGPQPQYTSQPRYPSPVKRQHPQFTAKPSWRP